MAKMEVNKWIWAFIGLLALLGGLGTVWASAVGGVLATSIFGITVGMIAGIASIVVGGFVLLKSLGVKMGEMGK